MKSAESGSLTGSVIGEAIGKVIGLAEAVSLGFGLDWLVQNAYPEISTNSRVAFDITLSAVSAALFTRMGGKIGAYMGYHGILNSVPQAYKDFREFLKSRKYYQTKTED